MLGQDSPRTDDLTADDRPLETTFSSSSSRPLETTSRSDRLKLSHLYVCVL